MSTSALGVIEGFYGRPWSLDERLDFLAFAGREKLELYIYAPKSDAHLRKRWRETYPTESTEALEQLAAETHAAGLQFGVGLSPYELYKTWDAASRAALGDRIELCNSVGVDVLALLFDDMKGDQAKLAELQAEIVHVARDQFRGARVVFCPTYYSDDPILDKMFGARPEKYLETLGRRLRPEVGVFWTGPKICSVDYPLEHLERISGALGRRLWIWDNYPVNDGPKMCPFLHLRPAAGRTQAMDPFVEAQLINPMNQATLSKIPILAGIERRRGSMASDLELVEQAARKVTGSAEYAQVLLSELSTLQDQGLEKLTDADRARLKKSFSDFLPNPAAREVLSWLTGDFRVTAEQTFLSQ